MEEVMSTCPVLDLPYFCQPFVLECDALGDRSGIVLLQNIHPMDFESMKLCDYEQHYSIYDIEILTIMHALAMFRPYLVANQFKVKTDHNSL